MIFYNMQTRNERSSRLRQSLLRLRDETARLLQIFLSREPMVVGSVYELRRKCGKVSCCCVQGEPHSSWALSCSHEGKTRLRSIPPGRRVELRLLTRRYQQFRTARARMVKIHQEMIRLIDSLEKLRRREP